MAASVSSSPRTKARCKIVTPIDDTPASKAGIKAGDVILAVDGKGLQGLSLDKVQDLLRGAAGTKVTLTLMRGTGDRNPSK